MKPRAWTAAGLTLAFLLALTALPPAARADRPGEVVIGGVLCFRIREVSKEGSIDQRVNHIHEVFAKHLGGPYHKFTIKRVGRRRHLYLNGDFVVAVWPADAKATGYKSVQSLARLWMKRLDKGFRAAHAGVG